MNLGWLGLGIAMLLVGLIRLVFVPFIRPGLLTGFISIVIGAIGILVGAVAAMGLFVVNFILGAPILGGGAIGIAIGSGILAFMGLIDIIFSEWSSQRTWEVLTILGSGFLALIGLGLGILL